MVAVEETEGVPVLVVGNDDAQFPCFYSRHSGVTSPLCVGSELAAARLIGENLGRYVANIHTYY